MKKILLIANNTLNDSGIPAVIMSVVRNLHDKFQFDIILFNKENQNCSLINEFLSYGGNIFYYSRKNSSSKLFKLFFYLFLYSFSVRKFAKKVMSESKYIAVHSFKEELSFPFFYVAKKFKISHRIYHCNKMKNENTNFIKKMIDKRNLKKSIKYANRLVAVSSECAMNTFEKKPSSVILNTYNEKIYNEKVKYTKNSRKFPRITQIGTYSSRKNQLFTLNVIKRLKEKYNNILINFIGYEVEEGYLKKLTEYIKNNNLQDNVIFWDSNSNQPKILSNTDFVLMPSASEAFGLVAIEAQACGIHCFASSNCSRSIDCGNIDYLPLKTEVWGNALIDFIQKNNFRSKSNMTHVSNEKFKNSISTLYQ